MLRVDSENTFFEAETPKENAAFEGTNNNVYGEHYASRQATQQLDWVDSLCIAVRNLPLLT